MVWVVDLEVAGQKAGDSFIITAGEPGQRREITVGRPPTKTDAKPDIVVMGKSVSKTHAVLYVDLDENHGANANRLTLADKSRYGTTVNNQKLPTGGTQVLSPGDTIQVAPQTFLMVRQQPLVVVFRPDEPMMDTVRDAAHRAGAQLTHEINDGVTHVFYVPGEPVWSALTHGLLHSKQLVDLEWLRRVAGAGLLVGSLPEPLKVSEVLLRGAPGGSPAATRVPLPPPCAGALNGLLAGLTIGFSSTWRDTGLTALLMDLGGRVLARQAELGPGGSVVEVVNDGSGSSSSSHHSNGQQTLGISELLIRLLTDDAGGLRDVLSAVRRCAVPAIPAAPKPGSEPEDSDMTQAADEGEEDEIAGAEVQQQQQQGGSLGARDNLMKTGANQVAQPAAGVHVRGTVAAAGASRQNPQHAVSARDQAAGARGVLPATEAAPTDCWMMAARRSEDNDQGHSGLQPPAPSNHCASPTHEDAPPPKRRRTLATLTSTGMSTLTTSPPAALPPPSVPMSALPPPTRPSPAAQPSAPTAAPLKAPLQLYAIKQEDGAPASYMDASGWMTQPRRASACHGMMTQAPALPPPGPAPAPAAVKQEPATTKRTAGGRAKGKAGKAAASSAAGDFALEVPERRGEDLPQVNDASAQVVMEVPLLAATPEQPPPQYRAASMEPSGQSAGVAGGFSYNCAPGAVSPEPSSLDQLGELEVALPDYKAFRKQGAGQARGSAIVQPLPVFVVDNFDNGDEAAAFLKQEEERAKLKRTADEAFKSAGTGPGGKRPPRGPKRG